MNKSVREAQQIIYTQITYVASAKGRRILADAAFHLGAQLWEVR